MHFRVLAMTIALLSLALPCLSQLSTVAVSEDLESIHVTKELGIIEDSTYSISFKTVSALPDKFFHKSEKPTIYFDYRNKPHWFKLKISSGLDKEKDIYLEIANPILHHVKLYVRDKNGLQLKEAGGKFRFDKRDVYNRNALFRIKLQPRDSADIFIYVNNLGNNWVFPVYLWEPGSYTGKVYQSQFANALYYGIVLLILFINIFIFIRARRRVVFYYLMYVFSLGLFQMVMDGYAFEYLFPGIPGITFSFISFSVFLSIIFNILFFRQYLSTREYIPRYHRYLAVLVTIACIGVPLSFVEPVNLIIMQYNSFFVLLVSLSVLVGSGLLLRKNKVNALFYMAGYAMLFIGVIFMVLLLHGIVNSEFLMNYVLKITSAAEIIILTLAIVDYFQRRQESIQAEALAAQKKINELTTMAKEKLEEEVKLRTRELYEEKERVVQQSEEIQAINESLTDAFSLLELKNKDITDSIKYARRIQQAILPPDDMVKKLLPRSFVFYKPKDIVSGDFYWMEKWGDTILVAAVDCTGHGVPGAFLSIVGNNLLNQSVNVLGLDKPHLILNEVNKGLTRMLHQYQDEKSVKDGMDIALCAIDPKRNVLEFAGAYNSAWIIREKASGEAFVLEVKGDKFPVGLFAGREATSFTANLVQLQANDLIYIFSDGYADQFGGPKGKKFKYKPLQQLLIDNRHKPMEEQRNILERTFDEWKGHLEQIDDVLVIGIKV